MIDLYSKDKLFGDFTDDHEAVLVWQDMVFLINDVLPALNITANDFRSYFDLFEETTQKFLVKLFHENMDQPWIDVYGCPIIHEIAKEFDNGIDEFFDSLDKERILGGHVFFLMRAIFDILSNVAHEYSYHPDFHDPVDAQKAFMEIFELFAPQYKTYLVQQNSFPSTLIAAYYACYEEIDDGYKNWQDDGLTKFSELYIQNQKLFEYLKSRHADLMSANWMQSFAHDFNREHEMMKCKLEFCWLIQNLLAQAFHTDVLPFSVEDLGETLATFATEPDGSQKFIYDYSYLTKAGFTHLLSTILHEFCHALQKIDVNEFDPEIPFEGMSKRMQMTYFFQHAMYRSGKEHEHFYNANIKERDAEDFSERGMAILEKHQLAYDVTRALDLVQPNAANG